jgi:O-acetyl-ADP-ribose deacetylase (regulator of RNase III)
LGQQKRYVIHAASPVYHRWNKAKSEADLRSAYTESLKLAFQYGCRSIAITLISSGIYRYPKEDALQVATAAITDYLSGHDLDVYLTVLD